jgi:hypothetical protein
MEWLAMTPLREQYGTAVIDRDGNTGVVRRRYKNLLPTHRPDDVLVQPDFPFNNAWMRWYREDELVPLDCHVEPASTRTVPQLNERWL